MTVTQTFSPPFAQGDVDTLELDFSPRMTVGMRITNPEVTMPDGGFVVNQVAIGRIDGNGAFVMDEAGSWVQAVVTATGDPGWYNVAFKVNVSGNPLLKLTRTEAVAIEERS